jgi:hypothetical protein
MRISKGTQVISSLSEWLEYAPPKSAHHWVDGRSAKEVARAWLETDGNSMPSEVHDALAVHPNFGPVLSWEGEPEAKLRFDAFLGEPRNCDLVVYASDEAGPYVLAIEAKADEPYGETVAQAFAAALERRIKNPRSNGIARILRLAELLLRPRAEGEPKAAELRYQLLTACAGAMAEAERRQYSRAVMLVHEFVTSSTTDINHERNSSDFAAFLNRLSGETCDAVVNGQLYGPFQVSAEGVQLFVGKVTRYLREVKQIEHEVQREGKTLFVQLKGARVFRGERKKWFELLANCDGQSVDAFCEAAKRLGYVSRRSSSAEAWLRYFVKERIVRISE